MFCQLYPPNECENYRYVLILSLYEGRLLLSRHRERTTWETQGGHIEPGETPLAAARRELCEESGVRQADLTLLFDCRAGKEGDFATGQLFLARVHRLGVLPDSEMAETRLFDELPANLTYPELTSLFFRAARERNLL